jgi:hypothetical protein
MQINRILFRYVLGHHGPLTDTSWPIYNPSKGLLMFILRLIIVYFEINNCLHLVLKEMV